MLSEVLLRPGPTHSVFDVLAAACLAGRPPQDIALLGFGGGSVVAALRALGCTAHVHAVDLDPTGFELLKPAHTTWLPPFSWHQADAVAWLQASGAFDIILDDLSVPLDGDVQKPEASWTLLPGLAARRLRPSGHAVFNLLRPTHLGWSLGTDRITAAFGGALAIHLKDFENRILVAQTTPSPAAPGVLRARGLGADLRTRLHALRSRQRTRLRIQTIAAPP